MSLTFGLSDIVTDDNLNDQISISLSDLSNSTKATNSNSVPNVTIREPGKADANDNAFIPPVSKYGDRTSY